MRYRFCRRTKPWDQAWHNAKEESLRTRVEALLSEQPCGSQVILLTINALWLCPQSRREGLNLRYVPFNSGKTLSVLQRICECDIQVLSRDACGNHHQWPFSEVLDTTSAAPCDCRVQGLYLGALCGTYSKHSSWQRLERDLPLRLDSRSAVKAHPSRFAWPEPWFDARQQDTDPILKSFEKIFCAKGLAGSFTNAFHFARMRASQCDILINTKSYSQRCAPDSILYDICKRAIMTVRRAHLCLHIQLSRSPCTHSDF